MPRNTVIQELQFVVKQHAWKREYRSTVAQLIINCFPDVQTLTLNKNGGRRERANLEDSIC